MSAPNIEFILNVIRETSLRPMERFLILSIIAQPELLAMNANQIGIRTGTSESNVQKIMPVLKSMGMLKRSLENKNLVLTDPESWRIVSRDNR